MKAVQLTGWQSGPELREVPQPEPGPGEVLLEVRGAGLCHSDLHLMHWPEGTLPYELPFTLGHESAGIVAALGPGADGIELGEAVLVYGPWGCGRCRHCSLGEEHLCEQDGNRRACGLGRDGGLADYLVIPSPRLTVPIADLDPGAAAPLADAALTPYHAIKRALPFLHPGAAAIVVGIGGLGHSAVQLLQALTSVRIVAVDVRDEALELARAAGADAVLSAVGATVRDLRSAAGGRGAAFVIDCVGSEQTLAMAAGAVSAGGHVAIVGMGGGTFPMRFRGVPLETPVVFSNWGSRSELGEVVALAQAGMIRMEVERVRLDDVVHAYERLAAGDVLGRIVAVPGPAAA